MRLTLVPSTFRSRLQLPARAASKNQGKPLISRSTRAARSAAHGHSWHEL
jgi:hypothetical protein